MPTTTEDTGTMMEGQLELGLTASELPDIDLQYAAHLGPLQIGDFDATLPGAYSRHALGSQALPLPLNIVTSWES